jgi:hypothetical protein
MNAKDGGDRPTLIVKVGKENIKGFRVQINGPSELVDAKHCGLKQLSCGARVYIQTRASVLVDEQEVR